MENDPFFITEESGDRKQSYQELITKKISNLLSDATNLIENAKFDRALVILNKLVVLDSDNYQNYLLRADCLFHLCDFKSAIINIKKAAALHNTQELNEKCGFYHFIYAQTLYDQRMYAKALREFDHAIDKNTHKLIYHIRKLACIWAIGNHNACLDLINLLISIHTENPSLIVLRAVLYYFYGKHTKCFEDVHRTLELDGDNKIATDLNEKLISAATHHREQAISLNMQNKHRDALRKINLAIETNPVCAEFHIFRGIVYRSLKKYTSAADDFLIALNKCGHNQDDPVYWDSNKQLILTYNDFAVYCYRKKFYEEAIQLLNKGIESEKNEKGLYMNRGDCFLQLGHYDFARSDYEQALEIDEKCAQAKARLAFVFYSKGIDAFSQSKFTNATEYFSDAIEFTPTVTHFYFCRAKSRLAEGNLEESKIDALTSLLLSPGSELDAALKIRLFPDARTPEHLLQCPQAKIAIEYTRTIQRDTTSSNTQLETEMLSEKKQSEAKAATEFEDGELIDPSKTMEEVKKFCSEEFLCAPRAWNVLSTNLPAIPSPHTAYGIMPDLTQCMDEREFHKEIYYTKKKIDGEVGNFFKVTS